MTSEQVLATDLDGTLIPLANNPSNKEDLCRLVSRLDEHKLGLVYVTGRHFSSSLGL